MRKLGIVVVFLSVLNCTFANGLLTNTNQSAQFIRMMSRNASLGIDGVYYNPAGLIKLEDGWHFSVSSQTIFQKRTIDSKFPGLNNNGYYEGDVNIPTFPTGFAVYKMDKWALSAGFGPNAGGGTAMYERGLPSFEIPIRKYASGMSLLTPLLAMNNLPTISGYDANLTLDGSSVFLGFQLGATYEVNEMLSVHGGVRLISANNKYVGSIRDISLESSVGSLPASDYGALISPLLVGTIGELQNATGGLQAAIEAGLMDPDSPVSIPGVQQIMALLDNPSATNQKALEIMTDTQRLLEALQSADMTDKSVDTKQTGSFFTPIIGVNISPNEFLNIGIKYEHKTYLTVENNTTTDDLGLFPDGDESNADIPGFIGVGIGVTDNYWFEAQLSANYYLDQYVGWGGNIRNGEVSEIDKNSFDVALGVQFNATDVFSLSGGVMYEKAGLGPNFNSDFRFATPSYVAFGGGIMWKVTEQLTLDAGVSYIVYEDAVENFMDPDSGTQYNEIYDKESMSFAIGLSYTIPY